MLTADLMSSYTCLCDGTSSSSLQYCTITPPAPVCGSGHWGQDRRRDDSRSVNVLPPHPTFQWRGGRPRAAIYLCGSGVPAGTASPCCWGRRLRLVAADLYLTTERNVATGPGATAGDRSDAAGHASLRNFTFCVNYYTPYISDCKLWWFRTHVSRHEILHKVDAWNLFFVGLICGKHLDLYIDRME